MNELHLYKAGLCQTAKKVAAVAGGRRDWSTYQSIIPCLSMSATTVAFAGQMYYIMPYIQYGTIRTAELGASDR